jgi:replicative DNA helicase Mcm
MDEIATAELSDKFLEFFNAYYIDKINDMYLSYPKTRSLLADIKDLEKFDSDLAEEMINNPDNVLPAASAALAKLNPNPNATETVYARFFGLEGAPLIQDVGSEYIGKMLTLDSLSVKRSEIMPRVSLGVFKCTFCGTVLKLKIDRDTVIDLCPQCKRRSLKQDNAESHFTNLQKIAVQDPLEKLKGSTPTWQLEVWLEDDLVNTVIPGDRIEITGILRIKPRRTSKGKEDKLLYTMLFDAISIQHTQKEFAELDISQEEEETIREMGKDPYVFDKIAKSIAPSIFGYDEIKKALTLELFGGTPDKKLIDGAQIRGDIHMLLIGDPGSAKTRLLQAVTALVPKGIYVSGKSTTSAGLTAAAEKDEFSEGGWTLKAGALVLGSGGTVCVTEDTELYNGSSLIPVHDLWEKYPKESQPTKSGGERKNILFPVTFYDTRQRKDTQLHAYAIIRRKYQGEIVKLTFASGLTLKVTPEHLLKRLTNVKNLWVKAKDVKEDESLRSPIKIFSPTITIQMDPKESYVIGCIYGDGWIDKSSITFSQSRKNSDVIDNVLSSMPSTFSVYAHEDKERTLGKYVLIERQSYLYTGNKELFMKCNMLLRNPSTDNLLMLNDQAAWAFLAGVFDTDGDLNHHNGKIIAARMYPTKSLHELSILLYLLRRFGIYARIHGIRSSIPTIQITGEDITNFIMGIKDYSAKIKREKSVEIKHKRHLQRKGTEKVVKVERLPYDGYVYDLSVGKHHNFEASLIYIHNCIDEFDKISDEDKSSLLESMESQTISIAKAGIVAQFNTKTSILAAANPKYGRFDPNAYPADQFDIPPTLLSRFDLIFPIKDVLDEEKDKQIAKHILMQHGAAGAKIAELSEYEQVEAPPISQELLRKYVAYAKRNIKPRLAPDASKRISEYYVELRKIGVKSGATPITPRQIEGLIRLAEASAKSRLSHIIESKDADLAISLFEYMLNTLAVDRGGRKDIDALLTGMPREKVNRINTIITIIKKLQDDATDGNAKIVNILEEAEKQGMDRATTTRYISELERSGDIFSPKAGVIKVVRREDE